MNRKRILDRVRRVSFFYCTSIVLLPIWIGSVKPAVAQQPVGAPPQRTGRSYDSGNPSTKPPPVRPQAPSPVTFTDITAQTGIGFRHVASPTMHKYLLETMSGGVALFDYDNDGLLDIFFTNGALLKDPMLAGGQPDKSDPRFWNRLYRQKSNGTFEEVTERAAVRGVGYSFGAAAADFDGDGFTDLYVTGYGGNTLYRNRGNGQFEDVTRKTGTGGVAGPRAQAFLTMIATDGSTSWCCVTWIGISKKETYFAETRASALTATPTISNRPQISYFIKKATGLLKT